ncbi:hypothetical protein QJQ45_007428 [Haematococcus lacustris]|nr:hypothetical protein QJQ45_007428 [Haematococcus lacustris]
MKRKASTNHDTKSTQQTQMAELTLKELEAQPSIRVEPGHGYHLQLFGKSEFSPENVYRVLIDPRIGTWRAVAKFLFLTVHFDTHLLVWEDDVARTIRFQHANSNGFMAKFEGSWHVHPFTQTALTQALATHSSTAASRGAPGHLQPSPPPLAPQQSLVTLEQHIVPKAPTPPGIKHLVQGLCAQQLRDMMTDLEAELVRRKLQREAAQGQHTQVSAKAAPAASLINSQRLHNRSCPPSAGAAASMTLARPPWVQGLVQGLDGPLSAASDLWTAAQPLLTITVQL